MINLQTLSVSYNPGIDISPVTGLTGLIFLDLASSEIISVAPILDNPGIGTGDIVNISGSTGVCDTEDSVLIAQLQSERGVTVMHDCP